MVAVAFLIIVATKSLAKQDQNQGQNQNQGRSEEHRSVVADFVQQLLNVADRQKGGIGDQVRVIAQEQNDSNEEEADAIESIEKRNKIKTFLIGTNYRNLGKLRSAMVQTRNRLEQLNRLMEQTVNTADKTELQNQISALEQERTRIENFIKDNESRFSLFGWLIKLFSKK